MLILVAPGIVLMRIKQFWFVISKDHIFKILCDLMVEAHHSKLTPCRGLVVVEIKHSQRPCGNRDKAYLTFHVTSVFTGLCNSRCGILLIVTHHLTKFGSHRPCGSKDTTDLMFLVSLQNHRIKGIYNFMEGSSSL